MTNLIKPDVIGQVRNMPPPFCLQTFDNFNRHNVISWQKSKWLNLLTSTWQWIWHAATIETLSTFIKRGQYYFLLLIVGWYERRRQSKTLTSAMPVLYSLIRFGWVTEQSLSFSTLRFVCITGMWLVKLVSIETIAWSSDLQKYKLPSQQKSNVLQTDFSRLFLSIKTFDAPCVRLSQTVPIVFTPFLPRSFKRS